MNSLNRFARLFAAAAACGLLLALAACGPIRRGGKETVAVPAKYDMVIAAAKDNQFNLGGAILNIDDLIGHFRYLEDQKQLPKSVLLKDGDDAKVKDAHINAFASLQVTFHFTGYIEHKGKLTLLKAVETPDDKAQK
ncbi:MAG: hypothetical protein ABFC67_10030 [Mizugakiibacter sp.]|uniref:hypothetical protein n=1 Tax=Mizugakiibacter sp. TaxID=1972610 RepID=UPI0031BCBF76|nr:hypothetical protein [Xanthomonadaceae bacterium]